MRISRAIDRFLDQMQVERDWTPRTIDSYRRVLVHLADTNPDATLHDRFARGDAANRVVADLVLDGTRRPTTGS